MTLMALKVSGFHCPCQRVYLTFSRFHFSSFTSDAFNGKHFPMELHVVFYNTRYKDMKEATLHQDGLCVMAFFFKIASANPAYEEMSELLSTVTKPHTKASFTQPLALQDLMLSNLTEYYVYNGSLTTPPCLEIVTWLDFYEPIEISHDQVTRLKLTAVSIDAAR
jgi:carbonic anhydrase